MADVVGILEVVEHPRHPPRIDPLPPPVRPSDEERRSALPSGLQPALHQIDGHGQGQPRGVVGQPVEDRAHDLVGALEPVAPREGEQAASHLGLDPRLTFGSPGHVVTVPGGRSNASRAASSIADRRSTSAVRVSRPLSVSR